MTVAPAVDLLPPSGQVIRIFAQGDFVHHGEHVRQYSFGRPYDWHFHLADGFLNTGWVDVDMNELCTRTELVRVVGDTVIETSTDRKNHVRVVHGHVGFVKTVHAQHTDELRVGSRERAQSHQGIGHRIAKTTRQFG